MSGWREEIIGDARLILGDCRDLAHIIPATAAIVSDPPYGMAWDVNTKRFTGGHRRPIDGYDTWQPIVGDGEPFDPNPWLGFREVILWGANHYGQQLPRGSTLVWIKKEPHRFGTFLSDCEIGWQKGGHGVFAHYRVGFEGRGRRTESFGQDEPVAHPTQKPLSLMSWCIDRVKAPVICDPFMGSGTTGLAAARARRPFIGIEIDPAHFAAACRRIEAAHRQADLFVERPAAKPEQATFDLRQRDSP